MSKIMKAKMAMMKVVGRKGLIIQKHSPEILMVVGITGVVVSTVMACKAAVKAEAVIDHAQDQVDKIKQAKELAANNSEVEYTEDDYRKDMVIVMVQTAKDMVKVYGPSVALGAASIACILGSHGIMKKRNVALMAAYKAVEQSFNTYRQRVVEEYGEQKDYEYRTGIRSEQVQIIEVDENGKKIKSKKTVETVDPNAISQYAKFFDETNDNWTKTPEYNLTFLKVQQNHANDLLHSRGHIFLNEVYDMIGIPRTQAGAIVGWVKGEGDDFVDFGIFDGNRGVVRDFVNGYERSILLDFNVAGVIYNLI